MFSDLFCCNGGFRRWLRDHGRYDLRAMTRPEGLQVGQETRGRFTTNLVTSVVPGAGRSRACPIGTLTVFALGHFARPGERDTVGVEHLQQASDRLSDRATGF